MNIHSMARYFSLSALACALAACGGGGGGGGGAINGAGSGGGGGGGGSLPPLLLSPATATIGSNTTPAQTATTSGRNFSGAGPTVGTAFPLVQSVVTATSGVLSPDTATNAGGATIVAASGGLLELKVPSLNIDVTVANPVLNAAGPGGTKISLGAFGGTYFLAGLWGQTGGSNVEAAHFVTGYQTPVSGMPSVGQAIYSQPGSLLGMVITKSTTVATLTGDTTLTANFGTGAITGTLHNITAKDVNSSATSAWNDVLVSAFTHSGSSGFDGITFTNSTPNTTFALGGAAHGSIAGNFYGPHVEEVGAVWTATDSQATSFGAIGARQSSSSGLPAGFSAGAVTLNAASVQPLDAIVLDSLNYTKFGAWTDVSAPGLPSKQYDVTGAQTPGTSMPTTGTASYAAAGGVVGTVAAGGSEAALSGDASFAVDFSSGAVTGALTNVTASSAAGSAPWNNVSVTASIASGTSSFSGATSAASAPAGTHALKASATGTIQGGFFGPSVNELGARWSLSNGDGSGSALGVVGARKH